MVFVNSKKTAEYLKEKLSQHGINAQYLFGGMTFDERDRIIDDFRQERIKVLISTNVLARGIDIPQVDIVINYDLPIQSIEHFLEPDYANYLHRIGRTGRFGTDGIALSFVGKDEDGTNVGIMNHIQEYYKAEIQEISDFKVFFDEYKKMRKYLFE